MDHDVDEEVVGTVPAERPRVTESGPRGDDLPREDQALVDLAASLGFFVRSYLHERGLETAGLTVEADVRSHPHPEVDGEVLAIQVHLPAQRSGA